MPLSDRYEPDPRWPALGEGFDDVVEPARFPSEVPRFRNRRCAERIGVGELTDDEWARHFARFEPLPGNLERPLALRYHGHQFGVYNPYLGDGRAFLFAQLRDTVDRRLLDLGTKGSGRTPWSRDGDGRLTLKGGVREVLASEMLEALGVYTSKSLSLYETGERLFRNDEPSPARGSVLVRLSHSFVRIGTFERLAFHRDGSSIRKLLEYVLETHFPHLAGDRHDPPAAFFREVSERCATLVASWTAAGFVHGVLNSDNVNVTGESFDYGPYRFLPALDPAFVAAYFDASGLYAFGRQAEAMKWNLAYLADALSIVGSGDDLLPAWHAFGSLVDRALGAKVVERLGLAPAAPEVDAALGRVVVSFLGESRMPFQRFFFDWFGGAVSEPRASASREAARYASDAFRPVRDALDGRQPRDPAALGEPYFDGDGPCDLLIDEVEAIWQRIADADDWSAFDRKVDAIRAMGDAIRPTAVANVLSGGC
ncbi:MAG: serine/tyrosine/threonine adenylyltransferase [Candidatus Binatota bacterium]|nr:serine/tyrosine/threonine adenylyltransferase [Candidatus Binatota bacterium]